MSHDRPTIQLSGPQILAGALAAASAAVVSSWMGVAGTVLGAVVVSLVASIGAALYTPSLERSTQKLRETLPVIPVKPVRSAEERPTAVLTSVDSPTPAPEVGRSSRMPVAHGRRQRGREPRAGVRTAYGFRGDRRQVGVLPHRNGRRQYDGVSLISHDDSDARTRRPLTATRLTPVRPPTGTEQVSRQTRHPARTSRSRQTTRRPRRRSRLRRSRRPRTRAPPSLLRPSPPRPRPPAPQAPAPTEGQGTTARQASLASNVGCPDEWVTKVGIG